MGQEDGEEKKQIKVDLRRESDESGGQPGHLPGARTHCPRVAERPDLNGCRAGGREMAVVRPSSPQPALSPKPQPAQVPPRGFARTEILHIVENSPLLLKPWRSVAISC